MNSKHFVLPKRDYTWTKHHLGWRSSQRQETFFLFPLSWFSAESTTLKLDPSAAEKKEVCASVLVPGGAASEGLCLGSSIMVVQRSTRSRGAHQFIEHGIQRNMKARDDSQALSDDRFRICAKRRKSSGRERWETEKEKKRERESEQREVKDRQTCIER